jgi:hypothetical protein
LGQQLLSAVRPTATLTGIVFINAVRVVAMAAVLVIAAGVAHVMSAAVLASRVADWAAAGSATTGAAAGSATTGAAATSAATTGAATTSAAAAGFATAGFAAASATTASFATTGAATASAAAAGFATASATTASFATTGAAAAGSTTTGATAGAATSGFTTASTTAAAGWNAVVVIVAEKRRRTDCRRCDISEFERQFRALAKHVVDKPVKIRPRQHLPDQIARKPFFEGAKIGWHAHWYQTGFGVWRQCPGCRRNCGQHDSRKRPREQLRIGHGFSPAIKNTALVKHVSQDSDGAECGGFVKFLPNISQESLNCGNIVKILH